MLGGVGLTPPAPNKMAASRNNYIPSTGGSRHLGISLKLLKFKHLHY